MRAPNDPVRPPVQDLPPSLGAARAGGPVFSPVGSPAAPVRSPQSQVLPFRRRRGLPVRRRSRLASYARPFLTALAIVGIPAAALWWSGTSARFGLADLEVRGSERVSEAWVRGQLADLVGQNLVWMPLDTVERTLSAHPWVAGAEVTKELPDRLRVVVVERRPAALLVSSVGRHWVGPDGGVIAPVAPAEEPGAAGSPELLEVRWPEPAADRARAGRILAAALGAARVLESAAPEWGRVLTGVEVLGDEEFRLEGGSPADGSPFPLLVRWSGASSAPGGAASELAARLGRLKEILPELLARQGEPASVDLRYRHRIVVRPAVARTVATTEGQKRGA